MKHQKGSALSRSLNDTPQAGAQLLRVDCLSGAFHVHLKMN
jgi:hypothetical protein